MALKSERELLRSLQMAVADLAELLTGKQSAKHAAAKPKRRRRSKQEARRIKKEVMALRKKGVPVSRIAKQYGVTAAYIYMLAPKS